MKPLLITLTVLLVSIPTTAHAEPTWDCATETLVDGGNHYPATPDEILNYCGHLPTIMWTDADWNGEPLNITPAPSLEVAPLEPLTEPLPEPLPLEVALETNFVKTPIALEHATKGHAVNR